jgi:cytochrome P450
MFNATERVDANPLTRFAPDFFRSYRALDAAWNTAVTLPQRMVQAALDEHVRTGKLNDLISASSLLPKLLQQENITQREALFLGVEAVVAAVDTTAQTSEFFVAHLANNAQWQRRLQDEIQAGAATHAEASAAAAAAAAAKAAGSARCPREFATYDGGRRLLRAALRESMRLTPTVGVHSRLLSRDIEHVDPDTGRAMLLPAGMSTMINISRMSMMPEYVKGASPPTSFDPTRFLRDANDGSGRAGDSGFGGLDVHPHAAAIPFGVGARRCAGAGLAQIFVETFVRSALEAFEFKLDGAAHPAGQPIKIKHKGLSRMQFDLSRALRVRPRREASSSS